MGIRRRSVVQDYEVIAKVKVGEVDSIAVVAVACSLLGLLLRQSSRRTPLLVRSPHIGSLCRKRVR